MPSDQLDLVPAAVGAQAEDFRDQQQRRLRKAGVTLSTLCSLAALSILFWLLNSGFDHLMDATDFLGRDPARDHVYWDMEFRSTEDLDRFPPEQRRFTNSLGMQLALIPAGRFIQGSPSSEGCRRGDEMPHRVQITRPFYLGVHDVTVGQFHRFVENTGYRTDGEKNPSGVPILHTRPRIIQTANEPGTFLAQPRYCPGQDAPRGRRELARRGGVLPVAQRLGRPILPAAHGGRVGIRVPRRVRYSLLLRQR